jgi:hypothetical protein
VATYRPRLECLENRTLLTTFTVLNLADGGDGSLRQAVVDANALIGADTIDFADGLVGTIALTSGQLSISDDLTINGPGADQLAVSGNGQSRVFSISGGLSVAINDLAITGGRAVGDGGGILNTGSMLAIDRVVLSNNQAVGIGAPAGRGSGGAVANRSGATLIISDSLIIQNQALGGNGIGIGGGIANTLASNLTVTRCSFVGNQARGGNDGRAGFGGGVDNAQGSTALVRQSTFVGNQAIGGDGGAVDGAQVFQLIGGGMGGALRNGGGTITVENSTMTGNQAIGGNGGVTASTARDYDISFGYGGGLFNGNAGIAVVRGSTFTHNQAVGGSNASALFGRGHVGDGSGGGLLNVHDAATTVTDSVFDHNEARGGNNNVGGSSAEGGSGAFIVGWGMGGAITNEGWYDGNATSMTASNLTLTHNRAVGGIGNTGNTLAGAGVGGGLMSWWVGATTTISDSTISHNQAIGGSGADALGGGLANFFGSAMTVSGCALDRNLAIGGAAAVGGDGGNGLGGGVYNEASAFDAASSLHLVQSTITKNHANGGEGGEGGSDGEGIGGGIYNLGGFDFDVLTLIFENHASTSHDNIFDPFA